MVIVIPRFINDSRNKVLSGALYDVLNIAIDNAEFPTDFSNSKVFIFRKENFPQLALEFNNTGENAIDYEVSGKIAFPEVTEAIDDTWEVIKDGAASLDSKGNKIIFITDPYTYVMIRVKEAVANSAGVLDFHLRSYN